MCESTLRQASWKLGLTCTAETTEIVCQPTVKALEACPFAASPFWTLAVHGRSSHTWEFPSAIPSMSKGGEKLQTIPAKEYPANYKRDNS